MATVKEALRRRGAFGRRCYLACLLLAVIVSPSASNGSPMWNGSENLDFARTFVCPGGCLDVTQAAVDPVSGDTFLLGDNELLRSQDGTRSFESIDLSALAQTSPHNCFGNVRHLRVIGDLIVIADVGSQFWVSRDGGASFTTWDFDGGSPSDVEVSPDGPKVFVLGRAGSWVSLKRSLDGGQTFDPVVWLPNLPNGINQPSIVLSPTGRLHVVRERDEKADGDRWDTFIYHTYSDDDGDTWSQPRDIASGASLPEYPLAAADSDPGPGVSPVLHLLCYERRQPHYLRSLDDGATFEAPVELRGVSSAPVMRAGDGSVFASGAEVYILDSYGGILGGIYSSDSGNTFHEFVLGRAGGKARDEFGASVAQTASGIRIYYGTCRDTNNFLQFRPTVHRIADHKLRPPKRARLRGMIQAGTPPTVSSTGVEISLVLSDLNDSPIYSSTETIAPAGCKVRGASIKCRSAKVRFAMDPCGGSDYRYKLRLTDLAIADAGSVGIIDLGITLDGVAYQEFRRIRPRGPQAEDLRENTRCLFK